MAKKKQTAPTFKEVKELADKNVGQVNFDYINEFPDCCGVDVTYMENQFSGSETRQEFLSKLAKLMAGDEYDHPGVATLVGTTTEAAGQQAKLTKMLLGFGYTPILTFNSSSGNYPVHMWALFVTPFVKKVAKKKKK